MRLMGSSGNQDPEGCLGPSVVKPCPARGVAPKVSKTTKGCLACVCTHSQPQPTLSYRQTRRFFEGSRHSLHAWEGVGPLREGWEQGPGSTLLTLSRSPPTLAPGQPTRTPGPGGVSRPRSRRGHQRAARNFSQLIAAPLRLRDARTRRASLWLTI